jgi:hypothetical protein
MIQKLLLQIKTEIKMKVCVSYIKKKTVIKSYLCF